MIPSFTKEHVNTFIGIVLLKNESFQIEIDNICLN